MKESTCIRTCVCVCETRACAVPSCAIYKYNKKLKVHGRRVSMMILKELGLPCTVHA